MSIQVWLIVQLISLAALISALVLPIIYGIESVLMLKIYYAVISVDTFLTIVLLIVVVADFSSTGDNSAENEDGKKQLTYSAPFTFKHTHNNNNLNADIYLMFCAFPRNLHRRREIITGNLLIFISSDGHQFSNDSK